MGQIKLNARGIQILTVIIIIKILLENFKLNCFPSINNFLICKSKQTLFNRKMKNN